MELSLEKKFEKEKSNKSTQIIDNTKDKTNTNSQKKSSFNINEIKAYLENNNENNDTSKDYNPYLITDLNNHFSTRREELMKDSNNDEEDLVMNQSYNYNPNISQNSSKSQSQNILQISNNNESQFNSDNNNYPNYLFQSEKKFLNYQIFPDFSTKKSTKTSISIKDEDNLCKYYDKKENEIDDKIKINNNEISSDEKNNEKEINKKLENEENKIQIIENVKSINITNNDKKSKNYLKYKEYEKKIIENEDEIFDIKIEEDSFGKYVDNIINRSYHIYTNRQCPSCANLLSKGKSCIKCPKYHHLIKSGKN